MTNKQIDRLIQNFDKLRQEWINLLIANPGFSDAAQHIISINSKIELLETFRTFED